MGQAPRCIAIWYAWRDADCWYDWQTLITGLLAVAVAFITGSLLWLQIRQSKKQEDERRVARFTAARAALPHQLSSICHYAKSVAYELARVRRKYEHITAGHLYAEFVIPMAPDSLIDRLEKAIEAIPHPNIVSLLGEILTEMQVLSSRIFELRDSHAMRSLSGISSLLDDYISQAAKLYVMSEGLFEFSRGSVEADQISKIEWATVKNKLNFWEVNSHDFEKLNLLLDRRILSRPIIWPSQ